jgi:hypothetical protein
VLRYDGAVPIRLLDRTIPHLTIDLDMNEVLAPCIGLLLAITLCPATWAASIAQIGPENRDPLGGKEVDWIDGDYVVGNDKLVAVIARPGPLRDANMTVRGVGACLIDLTRRDSQSDQLSCYYPAAGRYQFFDDSLVEHGRLDSGGVFWRCKSSASLAGQDSVATVEYQLRDGDPFLTVLIHIDGGDPASVTAADGVRADRTFAFDALPGTTVAYCADEHFLQTYGFEALGADELPSWSKDRTRQVQYGSAALRREGNRVSWTTRVYPAGSPLDLWGLRQDAAPQTFLVRGAVGDQPRIKLSVIEGNVGPLSLPAVWRSAEDGKSIVHLPAGDYRVKAEAIGHQSGEVTIRVGSGAAEHAIELGPATRVAARISDESGQPMPCKVTFYGTETADGEETPDPVFGLDSQSGSVGNCVYSADGQFVRSIPPGAYDVLISRGPEYDVVFERVELVAGGQASIAATLVRSVDTSGWVSAELHSHSTPSGDNTSEQLGRVENLICEHLEFAPCTEHQRIESYDDQLQILAAERFMATCSGMELTGSLLPINHQNAFPLQRDPFAQDGGGPRIDSDPINQIARLAMWDDDSEKVVQTNHPNMRQLLHDRDLDGSEDGGFAKMLDYMDIIEVHPPEMIFLSDEETAALKDPDSNSIRPWLQVIRSGRRIPGVVNTDAHYNWHGSGSLRNWIRCSTDDPAEIKTGEMVARLERGEVIMSTGPFMRVQLLHSSLSEPAEIGDSVEIPDNAAQLAIQVQCANWLDINRVEVLVNGEMQPQLSRTRAAHPEAFANGVVKFDQRLTVTLPRNAFLVVAAIGERLQLGRVMGESEGKRPPVVVSNPIYVTSP